MIVTLAPCSSRATAAPLPMPDEPPTTTLREFDLLALQPDVSIDSSKLDVPPSFRQACPSLSLACLNRKLDLYT